MAESTERTIIVYNIPYRTSVNLKNSTLLELVRESPNIHGVKDSSGSLAQALELISAAPETLSVLTGEDAEVAWWIPLLFAETNPMPLKHCLWRMGLIESPECRLPLTRVTRGHAQTLDAMLQRIANLEATGRIL